MDTISKKKAVIIPSYIEGKIRNIFDDDTLENSTVICADAGFEKAAAEGITPDIIVGDFDSSAADDLPDGIPVIRVPSHKDETDFELALSTAVDMGADTVFIAGGFGGRIDHTLGNIQNIAGFLEKGIKVTMKDEQNRLFAMKKGSIVIPKAERCYLSLLAYTETAVISVSGVEYPLDHHTISIMHPLGVSNEFTSDAAELTVHEGMILVMIVRMN